MQPGLRTVPASIVAPVSKLFWTLFKDANCGRTNTKFENTKALDIKELDNSDK